MTQQALLDILYITCASCAIIITVFAILCVAVDTVKRMARVREACKCGGILIRGLDEKECRQCIDKRRNDAIVR